VTVNNQNTDIIAKAISRVFIVAIVCSFLGWWISNRSLNENVMNKCKVTCGNFSGYVEEVTATKCTCTDSRSKITESPWVLPKK
jgi:hypothetical protein